MSSKNLFGQINYNIIVDKNDSLVLVDINTIRQATLKLLEREKYIELNNQKDIMKESRNSIVKKFSYKKVISNIL